MEAVVQPRAAATLVVVRDAPGGLELLLLRRAEKGDHNSGAWVFPGGLVDRGDRQCHALCNGMGDAAASVRLSVERDGLDYYVAAIRECFEEAGLLLATDEQGELVRLQGESGERLDTLRADLHRGSRLLVDVCSDFGWRLATDRLAYIAHWLTPVGRAKRFDTRFFIAVMPEGQASRHDETETTEQVWLSPAAALANDTAMRLMTPTRATIAQLAPFGDTPSLLAWARSLREVPMALPRLAVDRHGLRPVLQHEPAWSEVGRLDPQGEGKAWCEMRPGVAVRLSARVIRVAGSVANPPGEAPINSYLVGSGDGLAWAVIDPGPPDEDHVEALIAAAPGPIRWILATHRDLAAAARALAARTGARRLDLPTGEAWSLSADTTLRSSHLAGRPGHGTFLLAEENLLFTGRFDPREGGDATVDPDWFGGVSLDALDWMAPGRGFLIDAAIWRRAAQPEDSR